MPDKSEQQDRLGFLLPKLRAKLVTLDDERGGNFSVTREDCEALRDCIDLALAVRLISVDYR